MVPLDRALVSSYRLSIVTMSLSAAVWPQFATQVYFIFRALPVVYVVSEVVYRSKKLRSHLPAFGRRQYGRLPLAIAGLLSHNASIYGRHKEQTNVYRRK